MIKGSVIQFLLSQVRTSTEALIGGKVYFYQPGTTSTTGIKIWLDEEATSAANNPYTLDADATAQIYASGKYRIVIKDALGVTQFDRDDITFFDFDNPYEYDALQYSPNTFTQASITAALTAIGTTNKATLLLRPGTWVISSNVDWSAYTNVTFKIVSGAVISHGAFTVNIPNISNEAYQVFLGTGAITLSGAVDEVYPEWWGAAGLVAATDTVALQAAFNTGKNVFASGTYLISSAITWPTRYGWKLRGNKGTSTFTATASITMLTPPAGSAGQYGNISGIIFTSATPGTGTAIGGTTVSYIAHLKVEDCDFQNSLRYGIDGDLIENDILHNKFGFPNLSAGTAFKPIRSVGIVGGNESNTNRIKYNEIINAKDDYVVDIEEGFHLTFEGNTLEQNLTTAGVVYSKGIALSYFVRNWFEQNGAVPTVTFAAGVTGTPLDGLINIFDGNLINVNGQGTDCIVDVTNAGTKSLTFKNNLVAGPTHIVKNGASYDTLSIFTEYGNNHITAANIPITPNSSFTDWGYSGSGIVGGSLSLRGSLVVAGAVSTNNGLTVSTATATPVTILTAQYAGVYLVTAQLALAGVNYFASAIVINDGTTTGLTNYDHGANITITVSGANVQLTQASGNAQVMLYTILRLN